MLTVGWSVLHGQSLQSSLDRLAGGFADVISTDNIAFQS